MNNIHKLLLESQKEYFSPLWKDLLKDLSDMYKIPVKPKILDIGCGYGILSAMLDDIFEATEVVAISPEREELDIASEEYENINFICSGIEDIKGFDEYFDFVFSRGSYRFWNDKEKGFKNISRVLKKGGTALIGGGFGRLVNKERVRNARININKIVKDGGKEGSVPYPTKEELENILRKIDIKEFEFTPDDYPGMWIYIKK